MLDQVSIGSYYNIKAKLLEISGADYNEKQGYLMWKETLEPGSDKTYMISYEIKYGKDVNIVNR